MKYIIYVNEEREGRGMEILKEKRLEKYIGECRVSEGVKGNQC